MEVADRYGRLLVREKFIDGYQIVDRTRERKEQRDAKRKSL
jgi:hypothetical protein